MQISKHLNFITNTWSGGTTTELYIFPETAYFKNLDFNFRISIAKIAQKNSVFTALPNVNRTLMVLNGEITLSHKNHHRKKLKQFEIDHFNGGWNTTCLGTSTNFNLMSSTNTKSEVSLLQIDFNHRKIINLENNWNTICLYALNEDCDIVILNKKFRLEKKSLLTINNIKTNYFSIKSTVKANIILCKLSF